MGSGRKVLINTYEDYLSNPATYSFETMASIHSSMVAQLNRNDEGDEALYNDLIKAAANYTGIRAVWHLTWVSGDRDDWEKANQDRSGKHDSFITRLAALTRLLQVTGRETGWAQKLGYDEEERAYPMTGSGRKILGDFACYLTFAEALSAR